MSAPPAPKRIGPPGPWPFTGPASTKPRRAKPAASTGWWHTAATSKPTPNCKRPSTGGGPTWPPRPRCDLPAGWSRLSAPTRQRSHRLQRRGQLHPIVRRRRRRTAGVPAAAGNRPRPTTRPRIPDTGTIGVHPCHHRHIHPTTLRPACDILSVTTQVARQPSLSMAVPDPLTPSPTRENRWPVPPGSLDQCPRRRRRTVIRRLSAGGSAACVGEDLSYPVRSRRPRFLGGLADGVV